MYQQPDNIGEILVYNKHNPLLHHPNSPVDCIFAQTRESLMDIELYKEFLKNSYTRFRRSRTYKNYKAYIMGDIGLDFCQIHSNIRSNAEYDMATLEMHHNILTIFDISLIITEHILNTYGCLTTFDLCEILKNEHKNNRVCLTMLCKTCHQRIHAEGIILGPEFTFGIANLFSFLSDYRTGITPDLANKLIGYFNYSLDIEEDRKEKEKLFKIRDTIYDWSVLNEQVNAMETEFIPVF